MSEENKRLPPRVEAHLQRLRDAGFDPAAMRSALHAIRDDSALPPAHRKALLQMIAMESALSYLEALKGQKLNREAIAAELRAQAARAPAPDAPGPAAPRSAKAPAKR